MATLVSATISDNKIRLDSNGQINSKDQSESQLMSSEFLDVLVYPKQEKIAMIGKPNGKRKMDIFRIATSSVKGRESLGECISTGLHHYNPIIDSAC